MANKVKPAGGEQRNIPILPAAVPPRGPNNENKPILPAAAPPPRTQSSSGNTGQSGGKGK
jgi:hypothetical protein